MSSREIAMQRVSRLDESLASRLLRWLDHEQEFSRPAEPPLGARRMIGFAHRASRTPLRTDDWMKELREGDAD